MNDRGLDVVTVKLVKEEVLKLKTDERITMPIDAVRLVGDKLCELDRECVCIICLRHDGMPLNVNFASVGAVNQSIAHPRELLKPVLLNNVESFIMVHNHLGSMTPSRQDAQITDRMVQICDLMGLQMLDHIIVCGDNSQYYSFKEHDLIPMPRNQFTNNPDEVVIPDSDIRIAESPMVAEDVEQESTIKL